MFRTRTWPALLVALAILFLIPSLAVAQPPPPPVGEEVCVGSYDQYGNYHPGECDYASGDYTDFVSGFLNWLISTPEGLVVGAVIVIAVIGILTTSTLPSRTSGTTTYYSPPSPPPQPPTPPVPQTQSSPRPSGRRQGRKTIIGKKATQRPGRPIRALTPPGPIYSTPEPPSQTHEIPPSAISPGGEPLGGSGVNFFLHAYPPVQNLRISGTGNAVVIDWQPPANDPAKGDLVGYEVYRYEDVPYSTAKQLTRLGTLPPQTTSVQIQHQPGAERYGVNPIYRTKPDGRIIIGHVPE